MLLNSQQMSSAVAKKKVRKPVQNLISAFQECYRENFPATLLTLGAQVCSFHNDYNYNNFACNHFVLLTVI